MKWSWSFALIIPSLLATSACYGPELGDATLYVKIQSLDAATGEPLAGMVITSTDATAPERTTDQEGRVSFEDEALTLDGTVFGGNLYTVSDADGRYEEKLVMTGAAQLDRDAPEIVLEHAVVCADPPCGS